MDNKGCNKLQPVVSKAKKQVKDEFDRIKQAEKKKRRLEKALATSAAIRSELEKKKQKKKEEQQRHDEDAAIAPAEKKRKDKLDQVKQAEKKKRRLEKALATSAAIRSELEKKKQRKKEEQQRLDEDSAAIAQAVALHVLLGEDSCDLGEIMLNKEEGFNRWDCASNVNLYMGGERGCLPHHANTSYQGWVTNAYRGGCEWAAFGNSDWSFTYGACGRDLNASCFDDGDGGNGGLSADLIAAQAVSALQIREDTEVDSIVLNRMLRG